MWSFGDCFYFLSIGALSQTISFPIASCGPQFFSTIWGIFLFKEIKGCRNFVFLGSGFAVTIVASILIGISF
jgi:glucose uptake protein GlcU